MLNALEFSPQAFSTAGKSGILEELHDIFIQTVAHEMRTPLSILQVYAEMLHSEDLGPLSSLQKSATKTMVSRAKALQTVVERVDILLAARAGSRISIPASFGEMLEELVESRSTDAKVKDLVLDLFIAPDFPVMACDPYQLRVAIDCLLDNAFKFTPSGGFVAVHAYTEPGWVCLEVSDTGIGMPKQELEHVFDLFYQVDGSRTRRYPGFGLGLGVVKAVVEGHAGKVEVSSQQSQGSRFTIKLPESLIIDGPAGDNVDEGDAKRILVVDDEFNVAITLQASLEKLPGCTVAVATSGEEALQLFEEMPFDLLVTDYKMPGTDGMTLAAHIQSRYPSTSIIMVTAFSTEALRNRARELSVRHVLDKPVQVDQIRVVAMEVLGGQNGTASA